MSVRQFKLIAIAITGFRHHQYAPRDFEILCDGVVARKVKKATYADNVLRVAFPRTQCRALELKITGYYAASPAVRELEIYDLDPKAISGGDRQAAPP